MAGIMGPQRAGMMISFVSVDASARRCQKNGWSCGGLVAGGDEPGSKSVQIFHSSPDEIRLVVLMYVRFPLSLRNVEDLLFERGIDLCHETVRLWWNRFGPLFAADIRRQRVSRMREFRHWRWHVDEGVPCGLPP